MSTATPQRPSTTTSPPLPALVEGQRLDQPTFHERYEAMPPGTRAELIGGVVSMPSPVGFDHGDASISLIAWLVSYAEQTPGVQPLNNSTVILGWRNEPQPDTGLRVRPEFGGRTRNQGRYLAGAPELLVEVSRSTRYIDLGPKFEEYERAGVLEYVVRAIEPDEIYWYVLDGGRFVAVVPDQDGLYRSRTFPGLWLDPASLLANDYAALRAAVGPGLATPEHAAFVARLAEAKGKT